MRKIYKERLKGIIGLILILLAIAGIFLWENYGREVFIYENILVCNQDVAKGTVIEASMLGLMKIDRAALISDAAMNPDEIIGMQANTFIPRGLQISRKFLSDAQMTTGNGNYILSIPDDWLFAYPQSLRRGDTVYFYPVSKVNQQEEPYGYTETPTVSGQAITSMKVAFVKDSGGREVVDVTADRMDASASISNIEVVINDSKYQQLKTAAANQAFILMYE